MDGRTRLVAKYTNMFSSIKKSQTRHGNLGHDCIHKYMNVHGIILAKAIIQYHY